MGKETANYNFGSISHVKSLSDKNYQGIEKIKSPGFVLMFLSIESAFILAMQEDPELFNFAKSKNVFIVSPTTLYSNLMTVSSLWQLENQSRNAVEIAKRCGVIYDKLVGFVEDLQKVGRQLNSANESHIEAVKKLATGRGNILARAEGLKALGVQPSKALPLELLELDDDENA